MQHNAALNVVPPLRAQSAELAQADSGARGCGIKLRLGMFWHVQILLIQVKVHTPA